MADPGDALQEYSSCVLDACVLIAYLQNEPDRADVVEAILQRAESGDLDLWLPAIAAAEVCKPAPNGDLARLDHWLNNPAWQWVEVDKPMADLARHLVNSTPARKPVDALYVACGIRVGADVVFTYNTDDLPAGEYRTTRVAEPYRWGQERLPVQSEDDPAG